MENNWNKNRKDRFGNWLPNDREKLQAWIDKKTAEYQTKKTFNAIRETLAPDECDELISKYVANKNISLHRRSPAADAMMDTANETELNTFREDLTEEDMAKFIDAVKKKGIYTEKEDIEYRFTNPEVEALQNLVFNDYGLYVLALEMIDQASKKHREDPTGAPLIKEFKKLMEFIDNVITEVPEYTPPGSTGHDLIGFPLNAVVDWHMSVPAGHAFFLHTDVNRCLKAILDKWRTYLDSPPSIESAMLYKGWNTEAARTELNIDEYVCDSSDPCLGFNSWNDFFTREFKSGSRPVAEPDNSKVIVSACESAPYRISKNVQQNQKFWLKDQPYSLNHMLNNDALAQKFEGGTVYQAFLSATRYHRWHSPVSGNIVKAYVIPGTYYSELLSPIPDPAGPNNSQGYITNIAARAAIFIQTEAIGLVCFLAVGMAEVSTCHISVREGDCVQKGDELGYFLFGGSTHCLIFEKGVNVEFAAEAMPAKDPNDSEVIKVNSKLAEIK